MSIEFTYSRHDLFLCLWTWHFSQQSINEYDSLRCINKSIEIDEKDLDYTLSKDYWWLGVFNKNFDNKTTKKN